LSSDVYQLVLSFSEHPTSKADKLEPAKKSIQTGLRCRSFY